MEYTQRETKDDSTRVNPSLRNPTNHVQGIAERIARYIHRNNNKGLMNL